MEQKCQQNQQSNNKWKMYECKCGKSYDRNSSLFNHIKLKHDNNKSEYLFSQQKVGRPSGKKSAILKQNKFNKNLSIKIKCKCGSVLSGEGSFFNHVNLKHNGDPRYKKERKQQGRKKSIQDTTSLKTINSVNSDCNISKNQQSEINENQNQDDKYNSEYKSEEGKQDVKENLFIASENDQNSVLENEDQQINYEMANEQISQLSQQDSNNNQHSELDNCNYLQYYIEFQENMFYKENIIEWIHENRDNRCICDIYTSSLS